MITKIQQSILTGGVQGEEVVEGLKTLRPYAIQAQNPTLTRVIRMAYEHIEEFGGFGIALPEDEEEEDGDPGIEGLDEQANSLYYLVSLMLNAANPRNKEEILHYRNALKAYWDENA
ncbi:MAG: hypothetical protein HYZ16_02840 [Bacteroidetes bacterium]|nr:hypothetical protein [Bacteroidota bacterium]